MNNIFETRKKRNKFNYDCGQVFGRLTYTGITYMKSIYGRFRRVIEAVCECGTVREYVFHSVACGDTQSCGCYRRDTAREAKTTHNLSNHLLYGVWQQMIARCYNKNDEAFKNYGGRGIEVWKDWKESFVVFYDWCMANGYKEGLSLDRKENDGHYAPYNCWFVTQAVQNRNRRNNRFFTAFGETKCLFDWARDRRCKVGVWTLRGRMDKPIWENRFEEALTSAESDLLRAQRNNKRTIQITAFGETKCMSAWVEDKRCVIAMDRLRDRIAEGWDHFEAITTVHKDKSDKDLTAFGETKSMAKWLKDERCVVKVDGLRDRLRKGWKHEDCLSIPIKTGIKNKKRVIGSASLN